MLQFALESVKIWRSEGMELDFVQKLQFFPAEENQSENRSEIDQ